MIYVKPPRGDILLDELKECVIARINYFLYRYQQDPSISRDNVKFEYLLIGTALDRIGHFMLRLLLVESDSFREFVILSEAKFTIERLEFLSAKQIMQLMKTTLRHLDEVCDTCENSSGWENEMKNIFAEISLAFRCSHMVDFNHDEKCDEYNLKAPFQMCLTLVAKRELHMERGNVLVPCGKWKSFLKCIFETHMKSEVDRMKYNKPVLHSLLDPRFQELKDIVMSKVSEDRVSGLNKSQINSRNLGKLKQLFPPCMGYLYNNLKTNHRLPHQARFNLSLFLKDIGLPLNESILFWQYEYSRPSKCGNKCSHSWQKDSNRYTYSIRHLYGLEGKRANYCVPSCLKIQNSNLGPSDEGGCPFANFDLDQLKNSLDPRIVQNKEDFETISILRSHHQTQGACSFYRKALLKAADEGVHNNKMEHKTPVEYFMIINKQLNLDFR